MGTTDLRLSTLHDARRVARVSRVRLLLRLAVLSSVLVGCAGVSVKQSKVLDREPVEPASNRSPATSEAIRLINAGRQIDRSHPETAISYYREAALIALPEILREGVSAEPAPLDPSSPQQTYSRAIEYAIVAAERQSKATGLSWVDILALGGIGVRGNVGPCSPQQWTQVEPARMFRVSGLRHMNVRQGLGAPLLLSRRNVSNPMPPETHFPHILCHSASAVLRPGGDPGDPPAVLELHDPIRETSLAWTPAAGSQPVPLAFDISTPLARQFQDTKLNLIGPLAVLFPSSFDGREGIYMIDPYDPKKIPVIFVHGLMSSPLAWTNAMNDLRGDPALRERYQFWMFFYSTGNSIAKSAAHLRTSLGELQREFDPDHTNPNFSQTVLIGHSMGGLLSRVAVSSSGENVWNAIFKVPPDQLEIDEKHREDIMNLTHFDPVPMISRVVFICTPHQGSPLGEQLIGKISSSLIRLPRNASEVRDVLQKNQMYTNIKPEFMKNRQLTSVAQLGERNPIISIIKGLKISDEVPYHSIVGYNGKVPLPEGGDGVVPYRSAHIEGALSELVVSSDHSAQETQDAIVEMRRILRLHLTEHDSRAAEFARGKSATARITRPEGPTPVRYKLTPPAPTTSIAVRATQTAPAVAR